MLHSTAKGVRDECPCRLTGILYHFFSPRQRLSCVHATLRNELTWTEKMSMPIQGDTLVIQAQSKPNQEQWNHRPDTER